MPVGAMTVMVAGETPSQLNSDKLGEFVRQVGREVNHRPVYSQVGNENRMLWYSVGYWYLGRKDELGKSQGSTFICSGSAGCYSNTAYHDTARPAPGMSTTLTPEQRDAPKEAEPPARLVGQLVKQV